MNLLNANSTMGTAVIRGLWQAVVSGGGTFFVTWGIADDLKSASIAGAVAAFTALGFRGGVEGFSDAGRARRVDQKPGDVGFVPPQPGV